MCFGRRWGLLRGRDGYEGSFVLMDHVFILAVLSFASQLMRTHFNAAGLFLDLMHDLSYLS